MTRTVEVQPWTTLRAGSLIDEIVQEVPDWLDCTGHDTASVTVQYTNLSNTELVIEGCDEIGGSFNLLIKTASGTATSGIENLNLVRIQTMGSKRRLYDYLRWRVEPSGSPWFLTFKITATLK